MNAPAKSLKMGEDPAGRDSVVPAAECRSMGEVRAGIDLLDRQLVALMAARQGYIAAAARIKARLEDVRDEARIEDVVSKVLTASEAAGLSKRIAEPVWRELIERSIEHEHDLWRSFRIRNEV